MKKILIISAVALLFTSCEKVIDLELDNTVSTLVIEGNITDQPGPYTVRLSKTVNFDDANVYPSVEDATVTIRDDAGQDDVLRHIGGGLYQTTDLEGIEGRTYTLEVQAEGKTYTARSTMQPLVTLDSLRTTQLKFGGNTRNRIIPVYQDPASEGNYYQFLLFVNGTPDKTYFVDNDNVGNGQVNDRPLRSNEIDIETGNNVTVEMRTIDANTYLYYFTLAQAAGNGPGGGTTPSNPPNGISGGALGIFSAYTTQSKTITIR